jgi:spore maturation protein CgeB
MGQEWDDRVSHDYRFWMSDGVQSDEEMWKTGKRDLESLLKNPSIQNCKSLTLLEVGCGVGRLLKSASEQFGSVIGVDVSKEAIVKAKSLLGEVKNLKLIVGDGSTLNEISEATIDVAISFASLCSIPASVTASYLFELSRVVKTNGELRIQLYFGEEVIPEYQDTLGIRSYNKDRFKDAAKKAGFELLEISELDLPFEASNREAQMIASVATFKRNSSEAESSDAILASLISSPEMNSSNWLGSETAYHMSLARAEEQLNLGDFDKAKEALELAVRSYSKVEPEILQLLTELRSMAWEKSKTEKNQKQIPNPEVRSPEVGASDSSILNKNLAVLKSLNPSLAELVLIEPNGEVTVETSSSGELILQCGGTPLDNTAKPRKAAQLWIERALTSEKLKSSPSWLVAGFATGYHLEIICEKENQQINVFEPNLEVLRTAFRIRDLTPILKKLNSLCYTQAEVHALFEKSKEVPEFLIYPQSKLVSRIEFDGVKSSFYAKRGIAELKPNIAVVGPIYGGTLPITHSTARALHGMGQRVRCLDMSPFHRNYFDLEGFVREKPRKDALQSCYVEMLSQIVLESLTESPVDIVICLAQAPLSARVLTELRSRGIITVMWFVEDCKRFTAWKHISQYFDYMFCIQQGDALAQVEAAGAGKAIYLPTACEPALQRPMTPAEVGDVNRWGSELSFVGAGYYNRQQMFASLANRDFKIWGTEWSTMPPFDRLVQEGGRRIAPEEYIRIFNSTKINLNLHSSMERDGVEPNGDFVNPRTFELAACGAFQLVDERSLLPQHFEVGKEIITFKDLKDMEDKADYYLSHPAERIAVAELSRQRVLKDHSYEKRLEQMLGYIYADKFEELKARAQASPWSKTLTAAKKYPEIQKRLEAVYNRGEDPKIAGLIADIQQQSGKLSEDELKLLFIWHVRQSVVTMQETRGERG